jgi:hypothetical protein
MKRWFVEYETRPHGEVLDPSDPFDGSGLRCRAGYLTVPR